MTLTVREASLADEAAVARLWRECGLVVPYNDPSADFRFGCSGPSSAILVGLDQQRIVGSVMVGHDGHRGWLYYLSCVPDRQRSGVGRAMVEAAEAWLRDRGVAKVQLMVRQSNAQVTAFYERLGFEFMPRIAMAKWLEPPPER